MLSLYKLEIFAAVVQSGSFSAAAERLYMTQSAVSQHIQDLEAGLGTRLFNRGRRGVTLTASGEQLYSYTCDILRLVAQAENAVTDVEHLSSGQVTIGATPGVDVYLLPEWIQAFRARYRNLKTALYSGVTAQIVSGVLDHRYDIGFVEGELEDNPPARLGQWVLQDIELMVIVGQGHLWWQHEQIPLTALNDQHFITRQPRSATRIWIDQLLQRYQVRPDIVAELDNPESIKRAVIGGMGVAIVPAYAVQTELSAGTLRSITIADVPLRRTLKLLWDQSLLLPPVTRAFIDHLSGRFPSLVKLVKD
jgi:DNA-binding transcriptional LysR family regulator